MIRGSTESSGQLKFMAGRGGVGLLVFTVDPCGIFRVRKYLELEFFGWKLLEEEIRDRQADESSVVGSG